MTTLTDEAAIRTAARQLKQQGADYALVTLKDAAGTVYYASGVAAAAQSITENPVDAANIAAILREEGIIRRHSLPPLPTGVGVHRPQHGRALRWQQPLAGQRQRSQGRQGMDEPLCRKRGAVCRRSLNEGGGGMGYEQVVLTGGAVPQHHHAQAGLRRFRRQEPGRTRRPADR